MTCEFVRQPWRHRIIFLDMIFFLYCFLGMDGNVTLLFIIFTTVRFVVSAALVLSCRHWYCLVTPQHAYTFSDHWSLFLLFLSCFYLTCFFINGKNMLLFYTIIRSILLVILTCLHLLLKRSRMQLARKYWSKPKKEQAVFSGAPMTFHLFYVVSSYVYLFLCSQSFIFFYRLKKQLLYICISPHQ